VSPGVGERVFVGGPFFMGEGLVDVSGIGRGDVDVNVIDAALAIGDGCGDDDVITEADGLWGRLGG